MTLLQTEYTTLELLDSAALLVSLLEPSGKVVDCLLHEGLHSLPSSTGGGGRWKS